MQRLEVSGVVRHLYGSLGVKGLISVYLRIQNDIQISLNLLTNFLVFFPFSTDVIKIL